MTNHLNDLQLTKEQIGQIENVEQLIHFFATLGYDVDDTIPLDHAILGMDTEDLRQQIHQIHRIASDPDGDLIVYLFVVRSVTVALTQTIARRFRERTEEALLVFTKAFDSLDFVLLQKEIVKGTARGKALRQLIRPRPLTVDRRNPDPVALRVLKRFTFTEADGIYQWDKLCSAYDVAEWAEPEFNNRALFSDYYLKNRLADKKLSPEWDEDVRPIGRQVQQHLSQARQNYTGQPESTVRRGLYEPLFTALGFQFEMHKSGSSSAEEPDYFLYDPADRSQPIAAALTYVWNRSLDNEDPRRDNDTRDEIPGALVVSILENSQVPWVIMTNGKLWRLYSTTASNKATNYYEVDLEEALGAPDQITFMKYWWLFFRRQAFTGFLDKLLQESADYAKALGDRLKDRVFTQIFPHFAAGFIHNIRTQSGNPKAGFSEESLQWVYEGTLTFLYRLMFVLYAESLELLPLYEKRGYRGLSLYEMKQEIAKAAGTIFDDAPANIKTRYTSSSTALYDRLTDLFTVIDRGDAALNLPTYNGGLFSQTNENGEFLADYKIPDRQLALGLDRLCRDVDDKTQALAFIDFKSLGVRQLGSIYEGLLEFKLRIATEELAVVKEKGKEVYVPRRRLDQSRRLVQSIAKGAAYLENDKKERKATGSYYTPDYIVKYIVANTVGPVLARKTKELEPRLREAQKQFRQHKAKVEARGSDQPAALFWNEPAMRQLADDCLNLRVLDPAMGSGHFLVEVVDFVSNRLIDFLNGWTENPVWGLLERTRDDIVADMERQKVTIDTDRLTRVALLKRAVLKRCVYGVDLNTMAVELAKVSLWLDAFTLGAPLSFLDHHLKQGNSLIGARITEVREATEGTADKAVQLSLFSRSLFTGMKQAVEGMRSVSFSPDNTPDQVAASRAQYAHALTGVEPFKRVLDVYTSRWFGNGNKKNNDSDPALQFLRRDVTADWLLKPEHPLPVKDKDGLDLRKIAHNALDAAQKKRFFHWELEFPEVFFAPSQPGGQDVQLQQDGGFDTVVGNPPWSATLEKSEKVFVDVVWSEISDYQTAQCFLRLPSKLLKEKGYMGEITQNTLHLNTQATLFRASLIKDFIFTQLIDYSDVPVFDDPSVRAFVYIGYKDSIIDNSIVKCFKPISQQTPWLLELISTPQNLDLLDDSKWSIVFRASIEEIRLLEKIEQLSQPVTNIAEVSQGLIPYDKYRGHSKETIKNRIWHANYRKDKTYKRELMGSDVERWIVKWNGTNWISYGDWLAAPRTPKFFIGQRLLIREIVNPTGYLLAAFTEEEFYFNPSIISVTDLNSPFSYHFLAAIINSSVTGFWHIKKSPKATKGLFPKILVADVRSLPLPIISFKTEKSERTNKKQTLQEIFHQQNFKSLLKMLDNDLVLSQPDVIHDLLAYVASQLQELIAKLKSEQANFLHFLEDRLKILPIPGKSGLESLTGHTIIQNFAGDYQKDEPELPWSEFEYRLHQNRSRYAANLAQVKPHIQQAYEQSLAVLRPLKQQLAATDALIDQIVYKLYGLTDEEIELIERPAYEQALSDAKEKVSKDKQLQKDPDEAAKVIAETVLPAAKRLQSRIPQQAERARLDQDLPGWQQLPGDVPTFLLSGEYDLATRPEHLDFSATVISFAKAVENSLYARLFLPFREHPTYSDADCRNKFLQAFMRGEKHLTLGSYPIIMASSKEAALRQFAASQFSNPTALFSETEALGLLQDDDNIQLRNKAAHDELLTREDALTARQWALGILRYM